MKNQSYEEMRKKQKLSSFDNCLFCDKEDWLVNGRCKDCYNKYLEGLK